MPNLAYLCCTDLRRTYPSFQNRAFKPDRHTIACGRSVPLLWLGLFRPQDLRRDRFVIDGETIEERAPLVATRTGLARLDDAAERLAAVFPRGGSLAAHAEQLGEAIRAARSKYLTIELEEIAALWPDRAAFDDALEQALAYLGGAKVPGIRKAVLALTQLHPGRRFPPAVGFFDLTSRKKQDAENLARLLGTQHLRPVPWEKSTPRTAPVRTRPPSLDKALLTAMKAGDHALARDLLRGGADPNGYDVFTGSCWQAVFWGQVPPRMLAELIAAGGDVNRKHRRGGYPLIQAAWVGKPAMVRAMLRAGADLHVLDPFRRSALAIAARAGHADAVRVLLAAGMTADEQRAALREAQRTLDDPTWQRKPAERRQIQAAIALLEKA